MHFDDHLTISAKYYNVTSSSITVAVLGGKFVKAKDCEPDPITSNERKVPKRNPKAKPWVSPYGGKRK